MSRTRLRATAYVLAAFLVATGTVGGDPARAALPPGFTDVVVFSGLTQPTKVAFSPDGRVFVAEKSGIIKVFDSLTDSTPIVFADLRRQVYDYSDLGMVGLALPPGFPTRNPWVYVSYTYDAPIGGTAPRYHDTCPAANRCLASARVSRLVISNGQLVERVLLNDWCQQSNTHSIGDIVFARDGTLLVAGGDGASGNAVDYGQLGNPTNPCGDPPAPVGGVMTPPTAEGGALRAQDVRTPADPTGLSGTLIRVHPTTGRAPGDNPLASSRDPNTRRIVAYGLRNPFRFVLRPGTGEVWLGDVGFRTWEEIDRLPNPLASPVRNYGWPCYEGAGQQPNYRAAGLDLCRTLYAAPPGTVTAPYYAYQHSQAVVPGDGCHVPDGAITALAFYPAAGGYPTRYRRALFFADYERGCIWAMRARANGLPNPAAIDLITANAGGPVDLVVGPGNEVYYVDLTGGTVRRLHFGG
ncbi:PQQ-dependent sugar dehydrogenase [Plantactinospora solaniradicis]|uniref:PQQ-dependent sugar dehydrogenase n=1 Tax=Plantactinospora solaniradicis TaxID=1723736 RepID=A0ABW1KL69_9ACTN